MTDVPLSKLHRNLADSKLFNLERTADPEAAPGAMDANGDDASTTKGSTVGATLESDVSTPEDAGVDLATGLKRGPTAETGFQQAASGRNDRVPCVKRTDCKGDDSWQT